MLDVKFGLAVQFDDAGFDVVARNPGEEGAQAVIDNEDVVLTSMQCLVESFKDVRILRGNDFPRNHEIAIEDFIDEPLKYFSPGTDFVFYTPRSEGNKLMGDSQRGKEAACLRFAGAIPRDKSKNVETWFLRNAADMVAATNVSSVSTAAQRHGGEVEHFHVRICSSFRHFLSNARVAAPHSRFSESGSS